MCLGDEWNLTTDIVWITVRVQIHVNETIPTSISLGYCHFAAEANRSILGSLCLSVVKLP